MVQEHKKVLCHDETPRTIFLVKPFDHNPTFLPLNSNTFQMVTILYPENIPSKQKLKRLLATRRQVSVDSKSKLVCITVSGRTVLTLSQHRYLVHIQHFLWREDAIRLVLHYSAQLDISEELSDNLKMCLWYMDLVMEGMISESGPTVTDKSTFQSKVFDWYLVLEYWVR